MKTLAQARQEGRASSTGRFLRIADVMLTTGLGRSTIYRMIANQTFPRQVRLTPQTSGWWQADVDRWLGERRQECPQQG